MVNLLGAKKLVVVSNILNSANYSSKSGSLSLLATIPVDQPAYGVIIYENRNNLRHHLKSRDINKIDIKILDEAHNKVDFNNIDWTMLLCFYITKKLHDPDTTNNLITFKNSIEKPEIIPKAKSEKPEIIPEVKALDGKPDKNMDELNFLLK